VRAAVEWLVEGGGVGHSQPVWDDDGGARSCSSLMDRCSQERIDAQHPIRRWRDPGRQLTAAEKPILGSGAKPDGGC
jgi:hypothetical protein